MRFFFTINVVVFREKEGTAVILQTRKSVYEN